MTPVTYWGPEQDRAFKLKELLASAPAFQLRDKRPFAVHVDASDYAAGPFGLRRETMAT